MENIESTPNETTNASTTEEGGYLIGDFSFTGVNKENNSTKQITEGKFKAKKP